MNLEERKPIWKAISEFYLDTELQDSDYNRIAKVLLNSGKSIEELIKIDHYEVFPVLMNNLLNVASIWQGFEDDWLFENCKKKYFKNNNLFYRCKTKIKLFFSENKGNWTVIEQKFKQ